VKKAISLLSKARDILSNYWFSEDGEYNNKEVIEICNEIDLYLQSITGSKKEDKK